MAVVVGIPACAIASKGQVHHSAPARYGAALLDAAGCVPVLIPPIGEAALALLPRLDGLLLDGSPSNVEPWRYGAAEDLTPGAHDPARDATTLALTREALAAGLPLLAICRGIQELNVALGGTLHQRLQDLPGRIDHSTPLQPFAPVRTGRAHLVWATPGGWLHRLAGTIEIAVNSLHNQGIDRLAPGLAVEAVAVDGTIEAVQVVTRPDGREAGYAIGVQWHPEYDFATNPLSARIFADFAAAIAPARRLKTAAA